MSRRANPALIGAFVLGAIALVVAGIMVFGSGRYFTDTRTFILFFPGSVRGLNEGAPVLLRGVRVGSVVDVNILLDPEKMGFRIPVLIEIDPEHISVLDGPPIGKERSPDEMARLLIARGLRAQLQLQSFLTSQLLINLDIYPDTEPRLVDVDTPHIQIPTIPSNLERLSQTLGEIPLEEMVRKTFLTLEGIERFVNAPELTSSLRSLDSTLREVHELVGTLDQRLGSTDQRLESTLREAQELLQNLNRQVEPLMSTLRETSRTGRQTLESAEQFMNSLEGMTGEDAEIRYRLTETLREVALAARSLRSLADFLEANPDALLRGRRTIGEP
ncbi:MlaD family protein [Desulfuromonas sp. TF]|uniref:MlaD family protein n=1 Tax=Desulfuromonas sp. TF TaxID=1232410 RepID=UPI000425650F|nr:MlaD family protein [Desulfuromonas sp. TF]